MESENTENDDRAVVAQASQSAARLDTELEMNNEALQQQCAKLSRALLIKDNKILLLERRLSGLEPIPMGEEERWVQTEVSKRLNAFNLVVQEKDDLIASLKSSCVQLRERNDALYREFSEFRTRSQSERAILARSLDKSQEDLKAARMVIRDLPARMADALAKTYAVASFEDAAVPGGPTCIGERKPPTTPALNKAPAVEAEWGDSAEDFVDQESKND